MRRFLSLLLLATLIGVAGFAADSHEVVVHYDGTTATVDVAEDITQYITVKVSGADVTVTQSADVVDEITYRLSGETDNGSFIHSGDFKITLSLEGLRLASQTGVTMQIKNGGKTPDLCLMLTSPQLTVGEAYELRDVTSNQTLGVVSSLESPYSNMTVGEGLNIYDTVFEKATFTYGDQTLPYRWRMFNSESMQKPAILFYLHEAPSRGTDNTMQLQEVAIDSICRYLSARDILDGADHVTTCNTAFTTDRLDWLFAQKRSSETGIIGVMSITSNNDAVYDLYGRRVSNPQKGIYIQNSKKVIF